MPSCVISSAMAEPVGTPQRIALWAVPVPELGGVARHVLDATSATIPGWRVIVAAPPGELIDELRARGRAAIAAPIGPEFGTRTSVRALRSITRHLRADVVHSHLAHADIVNALASVGQPRALRISTEHGISGLDDLYQASGLHSRAMRLVHQLRLRRFDAIVAVSDSTAHEMRQRWRPPAGLPIHVVPNGIDLDPRRPARTSPVGGIRLVSISRLSPEKRIDAAIRAFAELRHLDPDARLTIAGTGPDRDRLAALITELGLDGSVDLLGFADPVALLECTDVLIQLSAWENCSYTLLDALRAGVGIVATPVGGNPELLPDRCLVVADDPNAIAERIIEQATRLDRRPEPPDGWPSTVTMAERIASIYDDLLR